MDLIVTVCDEAAGEVCPVWPGHPSREHWSTPDPAAYMNDPDKAKEVIRDAFQLMHQRITLLLNLPMDQLDRLSLAREARQIATATSAKAAPRM